MNLGYLQTERAMTTKYESRKQPGLYYWAEGQTIDGVTTYSVVAQANGYPASEAHDDWFVDFATADAVAKQLANETAQP